MAMPSLNLLPALQELPNGDSVQDRSFREKVAGILNMDRAMYGAEFASGVSFGMWAVYGDAVLSTNFPGTEINDSYLHEAYERLQHVEYSIYDPELNVVERWQQAQLEGSEATEKFLDGLKGIVAEFRTRDEYNQHGYNLELADGPYQPGYDLHGTDPDGEYTQIQVKSGDSYTTSNLRDGMERYPLGDENFADHYAVTSELYDRTVAASESASDAADRIVTDIGSDYELVADMTDGLETLSGALDITEAIPGVGAMVTVGRLLVGALKTENQFKAADRTTKNKMQVVQSLTLMCRMGVTSALATAGGAGGGVIGSAVPGVGNVVGGLVGIVTGAGVGMYLNKHLQPHMLNLALNITGLTNDDLFYYKNKVRVDGVAVSYQNTSRELATVPAW